VDLAECLDRIRDVLEHILQKCAAEDAGPERETFCISRRAEQATTQHVRVQVDVYDPISYRVNCGVASADVEHESARQGLQT
jgi:hypothetical protein